MKIIKLFEVASTDGYCDCGDEEYHLSPEAAKLASESRHRSYASGPIVHSAIETESGRYLLLKSENTVSVAGTAQNREDIAKAALKKLSKEEQIALGLRIDGQQ